MNLFRQLNILRDTGQEQIMKGVLHIFCSLPFISRMQSYLHLKSQVYLQAARVHFSNFLEAEISLDILVPFRSANIISAWIIIHCGTERNKV